MKPGEIKGRSRGSVVIMCLQHVCTILRCVCSVWVNVVVCSSMFDSGTKCEVILLHT